MNIIIQIVNITSSYFPSGRGRHGVQLQTVFLAYYSLCSIFLFLFRWLWKIFEDIVFGSTLALLSTLRAVKTSTSNPHTATGLTLLPLFYFSFLSYHPFSIYLLSLFLWVFIWRRCFFRTPALFLIFRSWTDYSISKEPWSSATLAILPQMHRLQGEYKGGHNGN